MRRRTIIVISLILAMFLFIGLAPSPEYDLVIKGGRVIDGSGNPWFYADIGIKGDRIVKIGKVEAKGAKVIDAGGLIVCPGFIDIHTHTDRDILDHPTADNYVRQGATTVLGGNCGGSNYPLAEFFDKVEKTDISINFATLVGHNTIRELVMDMEARAPTDDEMKRMKKMVARAMEDGAMGLSTGLKYLPGAYAETEEVIELAKVVASYDGFYATHMRDEGLYVVRSVSETIRIAEEAGIRAQISHHKIASVDKWGESKKTLELISKARARGVEVSLDQYPYPATSTGISILIPAWAREGGRDEFRKRVSDPALRAKIEKEVVYDIIHDRGAADLANVTISSCYFDRSLEGKDLKEITAARGFSPTIENGARVVIDIELAGGASCIFHCLSDKDIRKIMEFPLTMAASDGSFVTFGRGVPHPRNYGTFPRVLSRYVREKGWLTLSEAIRKMSSLPAIMMRLERRGIIAPGFYADITIFDTDKVADKATFLKPHQYPVGISYVIVNGKVVVSEGKHTGLRPGRVLYGRGRRRR
jgi:N-acyl-D-amino-acid deacylase